MPTDLNILDDWWDKGFDAGVMAKTMRDVTLPKFDYPGSAKEWNAGWYVGRAYRRALKARPASPRDTEISDLEEFMR